MEFAFDVQRLFGDSTRGVICVNGRTIGSLGASSSSRDGQVREVLDTMGVQSAKAQKLSHPISSYRRLVGADQRLYLKVEGRRAVGFIKVGPKRLFISTRHGMVEIEPICVLDFYVHESVQRKGEGLILFRHMLENENLAAHQLGYDRPSPKFLKFLCSRYALSDYVPQNNNFVVFSKYFSGGSGRPSMIGNEKPSSASSQGAASDRTSSGESMSERVPSRESARIPKTDAAGITPWAQNTRSKVQNDVLHKREKGQKHEYRAIDSVAACLGLMPNPHGCRHKNSSMTGTPPYLAGYPQSCKHDSRYRMRDMCSTRPF